MKVADIRKHMKDYKYTCCSAVQDSNHELVKAAGATVVSGSRAVLQHRELNIEAASTILRRLGQASAGRNRARPAQCARRFDRRAQRPESENAGLRLFHSLTPEF